MDKKVKKLNSGWEILSLIFLKIKYESQLSCLSHFIAFITTTKRNVC